MLLRYASNSANQTARRANSGGVVYPDKVGEISARLTEAGGLSENQNIIIMKRRRRCENRNQ